VILGGLRALTTMAELGIEESLPMIA